MLFYEVKFTLKEGRKKVSSGERYALAYDIQNISENFFTSHKEKYYIAVTNIAYEKGRGNLCAAGTREVLSESLVKEFLKETGIKAEIKDINEITYKAYNKLIILSMHNDFIGCTEDVCNAIGLDELHKSHSSCYDHMDEYLITETYSKKELYEMSELLLCASSMQPELDRIFDGSKSKNITGHPVQYIVRFDDKKTKNKILKVLLNALYQNKRIYSRRYSEFHIDRNGCNIGLIETFYKRSNGGVLIMSADEGDIKDTEFASNCHYRIPRFAQLTEINRNDVLTVYCIDNKDEKKLELLLNNLKDLTVVTISQEKACEKFAKRYLEQMAKERGVEPNKRLFSKIRKGKSYTSENLNTLFTQWYDGYLRSEIYPQYSTLDSVNKKIATQKPKGFAIDELHSLIGLKEAKAVIQQALDFYKAQKLFRKKGFEHSRPAMHMVFTGNPGSAKTTVARLFAQIMKDNNLLSAGDLHEVGRADLVGKYVGSTAPKVKEIFKAAKGSVLFIDEAYSLVDDRDGLFGDEAITTIVQEMENCRDNMVVIFAGYPDKMEGFLNKNPGLRSRIAFHVPFSDYNADELCDITELMAKSHSVTLGDGVRDKLHPIYENALQCPDFGNGRYARNLFEKAVMRQATRLVNMDVDDITKDDLQTLAAEDFEGEMVKKQIKLNKIGF